MEKVILFKDDSGVGVIYPTKEGLYMAGGNIKALAEKDVPHGAKFKIIDKSELPSDRNYRDAWDIDGSELGDGIGNKSNLFDSSEVKQ